VLEALEIAGGVLGALALLAFFLAPRSEEWERRNRR
jgi:hypothetical protein